MNEIWVAVIGVLGSIVAAIITSQQSVKRSLGDSVRENRDAIARIEAAIAVLSLKVDTMWDIGVKDALRAARKQDLVAENSPVVTTLKWRELLTEDLSNRIDMQIRRCLDKNRENSLLEIEHCVVTAVSRDLYLLSIERDVTVQTLWGALRVHIKEIVEGIQEHDRRAIPGTD